MANKLLQGSQFLSGSQFGSTAQIGVVLGTNTFVGRTVYLTGFSYQASGATAAAVVTISALYSPINNGAIVLLGSWVYQVPAGATINQAPMVINLIPPLASNALITGVNNITSGNPTGSITVTATSAGAGATFAGISAWGYLL